MSSIVFDAEHLPRAAWVQGYWFEGSDFSFTWPTDPKAAAGVLAPPPGLDGAYVTVRHVGGEWRLGVDHDGCRRLFVYRNGSYWAVGDSLMGLARHVNSRGHRLTALEHHLIAWEGAGAFLQQLWSHRTVFAEIELIPADREVVISGPRLRDRFRSSNAGPSLTIVERVLPPLSVATYEEALHVYLSQWLSRCSTLIASEGVRVSVDLTGGLDSRTTFGLFTRLRADSSLRVDTIRVFSDPRQRTDDEIAHRIAELVGVPVGGRSHIPVAGRSRHGHWAMSDRFEYWLENRLGQYAPALTLPSPDLDPTHVSIGGFGGERYRPFYANRTNGVRHLIRRMRRWLPDQEIHRAFESDLMSEIESWKGDHRSGDPLLRHYREFRARFHLGCTAAEHVKISPLSGRYLDRVAELAGDERLASGQILYDILINLDSHLAEFPFDHPGKAPSADIRSRVPSVGLGGAQPGRMVVATTPSPGREAEGDSLTYLERKYVEAAQHLADLGTDVPPTSDLFDRDQQGQLLVGVKAMQPIHAVFLRSHVAHLCRRAPSADAFDSQSG